MLVLNGSQHCEKTHLKSSPGQSEEDKRKPIREERMVHGMEISKHRVKQSNALEDMQMLALESDPHRSRASILIPNGTSKPFTAQGFMFSVEKGVLLREF